MKSQLMHLIRTARGGTTYGVLLSRITDMSDEEAAQWVRLIKAISDDARRDGSNTLARRMGLR
jgi:hypothetical protein